MLNRILYLLRYTLLFVSFCAFIFGASCIDTAPVTVKAITAVAGVISLVTIPKA